MVEIYTIREEVKNNDTDLIAKYLNKELVSQRLRPIEYEYCTIQYSEYDEYDDMEFAIHFCFVDINGEEFDISFDLPEWHRDELRDAIGVDIYPYNLDYFLESNDPFYTKIYLICERYMRGVL